MKRVSAFYVTAKQVGSITFSVCQNNQVLDLGPFPTPGDAWEQVARLVGPKAVRTDLPDWVNPPDGEKERSCYLKIEIISDRCHCGHIHGDHADGQNECCHGCGCRQFVSESDSKPEAQNAETR